MPDVILKADGMEYGGWKAIRITSGINSLSGAFELSLSERWPAQPERRQIKAGTACQVFLGSACVITGYVDEVNISYGSQSHPVRVRGRDKTGDLVDCSYDGETTQWKNITLLKIAKEICKPFGIDVLSETETGGPFESVSYGQGDTVESFLRRLARQRGVLMTSNPDDGNLIFTKAAAGRAPVRLVLGENIKSSSVQISNLERFSHYLVKGQGNALGFEQFFDDQEGAEENAIALQKTISPHGKAIDEGISRYRPKVVLPERVGDIKGMEERAAYEARSRKGRSRRATYIVQGWEMVSRDAAGTTSLWRPNLLVDVVDAWAGIEGQCLIESISYVLDGTSGTISEITVVPPDAYTPEPAKPENAADSSTWSFF